MYQKTVVKFTGPELKIQAVMAEARRLFGDRTTLKNLVGLFEWGEGLEFDETDFADVLWIVASARMPGDCEWLVDWHEGALRIAVISYAMTTSDNRPDKGTALRGLPRPQTCSLLRDCRCGQPSGCQELAKMIVAQEGASIAQLRLKYGADWERWLDDTILMLGI
jgi:hypothetical protein